jgi:DNA (cytosine-5)-methyltransferase 1
MRVIDLFAGCGGLSLGFQNAGYEIVGAFENWKPAIDTYRANFDHPILEKDLSKITDYSEFSALKPDMIIGGPPCQDFSSAGKRNEDNGRGDLTINYAEIVSNVRPEWFVMENVERILKTQKLKQAKEIFSKAGYGLSEIVLDASYCGVPQMRKRYILIGKLGETNHFMDYYLTKNQSTTQMSIYDYLGNSLGIEHYYRHPRSYARRGVFSIYEPSPTIRGVNRPIPKGYVKHDGDPIDDLSKVRPLTTKERTYLQTFPESFKWSGSKTELEQIIGNAVPVNLAKFLGDNIKEYINDVNINGGNYRIGMLDFEHVNHLKNG